MRTRRVSPIRARNAVAKWNYSNTIGTNVYVTRDNGEKLFTTTRSDAFIAPESRDPVIMVDMIASHVLLDRVTPAVKR